MRQWKAVRQSTLLRFSKIRRDRIFKRILRKLIPRCWVLIMLSHFHVYGLLRHRCSLHLFQGRRDIHTSHTYVHRRHYDAGSKFP